MKKIAITSLVGLGVALILPGCGGGGAKNYNITRTTTVGQELQDLKDAFERGAMTQSEYEESKEKILTRDN